MARMATREAAIAWKRCRDEAKRHARQELRDTPIEQRFRRVSVMLASGREAAFAKGKTEETETARAIWLRLKAR